MEENLRAVQAISQDQPHSTVVEIPFLSDHGGFVCNTCGVAFASEEGRAMHIEHRHPEIHLQAGAAFNRGTHSLSLASSCVDCVAGIFTIGGQCANASLAGRVLHSRRQPRGISEAQLLTEVRAWEQRDTPKALVQMPDVHDVGEYAEWLDAPIQSVLNDKQLHQRLRSGFAICSQRLVGSSRVKTHWQQTHKVAWTVVESYTQGGLRSLSSAFTSPCCYCGSRARDASAHAVQCSVMFQVIAMRELHRLKGFTCCPRGSQTCATATEQGQSAVFAI